MMKRIPLNESPRRSERVRRARRVGVGWLVESLESRTLLSSNPSGALDSDFLSPVEGAVTVANIKNPPSPICTTPPPTDPNANVNTDCPGTDDGTGPHNETSIAVNPINPLNMITNANDYQLLLTPGGHVQETAYTRAHVTFNGGQTWSLYPINFNGYKATGDPAIAFDAAGRAYMATLGFVWNSSSNVTAPDVLVESSSDGGQTWSTPTRVASGTGNSTSVGNFNDKEYLTAWGNGNAIVTWTIFHDGQGGKTINSPIYDSVTHNGGQTWSAPTLISGANDLDPKAQDEGSVPIVAANGSIYVAYIETVNLDPNSPGYQRDQYMVVKVDPATGQPLGAPVTVANLVDGAYDYPINILGRQTYQDSEFRTWSLGNIAADPTNPAHLAVVWSDMRNNPSVGGPSRTHSDPYTVKTNSDIIVSQSSDGGATWSAPVAITAPGDQFMPWGAYDASGNLQIGFFDRSYDPANHQYGYTLASETAPGSLTFTTKQLTKALSDPTKGDRWFAANVNSSFPHATTFLGDYSNIAVTPDGQVVAVWTDMREPVTFANITRSGENAYFAKVGDPASASASAPASAILTPLVSPAMAQPAMAQVGVAALVQPDDLTSEGWLETLFTAKGKRHQHTS